MLKLLEFSVDENAPDFSSLIHLVRDLCNALYLEFNSEDE